MAFDFAGRTAFITGGASGAGFGQAQVFGRAGCKIAIADIRGDAVQTAVSKLKEEGIEAYGVELDITDRAAFQRAADEVEDALGPVSMLFGTAGVSIFGPLEQASYSDYDWIMDVNFNGVVNLMQTFVPRMIERNQGGHIVNTASLGCFMANSSAGIYSASKFAVHGITMAMRDALKDHAIGVSVLAPANIKSNIAESVKTRPDRYGESAFDVNEDEIAALHEIYAQGMEPEELAGHVKQAIEENRFYIIPYPEARAGLEAIFKQALDALPPADSDESGQEKRAQAMHKYIEARQQLDKQRYGTSAR
ncbi:SDR family NAD(P)-dependent oxidoreductase [Altericroceibacterium endophyticum]|uniref:SDR family NAD(P)-dependent oxidoreductase n=1 Tax=Altericroceibacterium endophyticum TaxID=1808508 RepID=A0A6I4T245_9SPHN|nr:SDR family NAD(P)-dependent oxidoreductase [Altericroceibacterium endophyticum]MXO64412.1 SDR family NAD(P)-dependent oxidoreductase [Altericroceibacterium endophyticum]